jgi:hypothetical protein
MESNTPMMIATRHPTGFRRGLLVIIGVCHLFLATASHAADIAFTLDKPGNVSLAIYDAKGRMIRTLQNAKPLAAGPHALAWDGLDQYGAPQPPGSYTWKALGSPGLEATFLGPMARSSSCSRMARSSPWIERRGATRPISTMRARCGPSHGMCWLRATIATARAGR